MVLAELARWPEAEHVRSGRLRGPAAHPAMHMVAHGGPQHECWAEAAVLMMAWLPGPVLQPADAAW